MDYENITLLDLLEKIEDLESDVRKLNSIIEFHGLNKIDRKYWRAFPKKGESLYFKTDKFKKANTNPSVSLISSYSDAQKIDLPKDPLEYEKAKERMWERSKMAKDKEPLPTESLLKDALDWRFEQNTWYERDKTPPPIHLDGILVLSETKNTHVVHWEYESWCLHEMDKGFAGETINFTHWMLLPTQPKLAESSDPSSLKEQSPQ